MIVMSWLVFEYLKKTSGNSRIAEAATTMLCYIIRAVFFF